LQEGGGQVVFLKLRRERCAVGDQRKEIGLGIQLAQRLDNALAAAATGKPVMNYGYAHFTHKDLVRTGERASKPFCVIRHIDGS